MFHNRHQLNGIVALSDDARKHVDTIVLVGSNFSFPRTDANMGLVDSQALLLFRLRVVELVDLIFGRIVEDTVVCIRLFGTLNIA